MRYEELSPDQKRLLSKLQLNEQTNCLEFTGHITPKGYGQFGLNKKVEQAHRAMWILFVGNIPNNLFVCHSCDNRKCCNLNHLFLGTNQDNMNDAINKDRLPVQKIIPAQAKQIRLLFQSGNYSTQDLADVFKLSSRQIGAILRGQCYKFAGGPTIKSIPKNYPALELVQLKKRFQLLFKKQSG